MEMKGNTLAIVLLVVGLVVGAGAGYMLKPIQPYVIQEPVEPHELNPAFFEYHQSMKIGEDTPVFTAYYNGAEYLVYYKLVNTGYGGVTIWWRYVEV